jgi:hypothetical protein
LIAGEYIVPAFSFVGAAGVRLPAGVGFVGVLHGRIVASLAANSSIHLYGLGPGIRFGNRTQVTLGVSPTLAAITLNGNLATGFLFSVFAQGALVLGPRFTFLVQTIVDFGTGGTMGAITGGLGASF